jgi:hypothetical protein
LITQHARPHEWVLQVQFINAAHQRQVSIANGPWPVVHQTSADLEQLGLVNNWQFVASVDHGFALSNPALVSALFKKSNSNACWPILACNGTRSTGASTPTTPPKTLAAF